MQLLLALHPQQIDYDYQCLSFGFQLDFRFGVLSLAGLRQILTFSTKIHVWSGRSCDFIMMFQKTSEMVFSDRVSIENAQVYVSTPSELRER